MAASSDKWMNEKELRAKFCENGCYAWAKGILSEVWSAVWHVRDDKRRVVFDASYCFTKRYGFIEPKSAMWHIGIARKDGWSYYYSWDEDPHVKLLLCVIWGRTHVSPAISFQRVVVWFHPFCGYRFGRWQQSHLRITEHFWLLVRFIRAEDSSEIAVSVSFWSEDVDYAFNLSLADKSRWYFCWTNILLTNLADKTRRCFADKSQSSISLIFLAANLGGKGKRERFCFYRQISLKGCACQERKAGVWMEPYLAWNLAKEEQRMSL